jgi:hypothetical protein
VPLDDGTFEDYARVLVYLWGRFSESEYAAGFLLLSEAFAKGFATWLKDQQLGDAVTEDAATWWKGRGLGLMPWERDFVARWMEFSEGEYYAGFIWLDPGTAEEFANWLGGRGKRSRPSPEHSG